MDRLNTTLTIKYTYGGGIGDNVVLESIRLVTSPSTWIGLNSGLVTTVRDSMSK